MTIPLTRGGKIYRHLSQSALCPLMPTTNMLFIRLSEQAQSKNSWEGASSSWPQNLVTKERLQGCEFSPLLSCGLPPPLVPSLPVRFTTSTALPLLLLQVLTFIAIALEPRAGTLLFHFIYSVWHNCYNSLELWYRSSLAWPLLPSVCGRGAEWMWQKAMGTNDL